MSSSPHRDHTEDLARLVRLSEDLGSRHTARDAGDPAARVAEGRFFPATVGRFKRGKSTLLNAPLGNRSSRPAWRRSRWGPGCGADPAKLQALAATG